MAIEVVNSTSASGLEFFIVGYVDGSATSPMWSGSLAPSGQQGASVSMTVSGYESYGVAFFTVGWLSDPDQWATAMSPEVTDNTLVELAINVEAS
jgi:hypothetical protein